MKRRWLPTSSALAVVTLMGIGAAVAQQNQAEGTRPSQDTAEKATPEKTPPAETPPGQAPAAEVPSKEKPASPGEAGRTPENLAAQRGAAPFLKLQFAMKKALILTKEQEEKIDGLFRDQVRMVRDPHRPIEASPEATDELMKLRNQIDAARDAGDLETVRKLREEFREKLRSRPIEPGMSMAQFLERVAAELTDEQRPVFMELAKAAIASPAYPIPLTRDAYVIWRAVLAPEVGASTTQKEEIRAILRSARSGTDSSEGGEGKAALTAEELKAKVLEKLTPEQRVKVEAAVNAAFNKASRKAPAAPDQARTDEEGAKNKDASSGKDDVPREDKPD